MSRRSRTLDGIAARKRELIERAAVQREALAEATAALAPVFAAGDRVAGVGRSILSRRLLLAGAGVLLVVLWPRAIFAAAARAFALWNGARAVRRLVTHPG